jgi:hypothetical protein
MLAVSNNIHAIKYIGKYDEKMVLDMVKQNPNVVTVATHTETVYYTAVTMKPSLFKYVPSECRTKRICYAALCDHSMRSIVGKYLNLPTIFFKSLAESQTRDQIYFRDGLKKAKKYIDIIIHR